MGTSLVEKRQNARKNRIFTLIKENDNQYSRNDICKITKYSMTTVASVVENCIEDGFLVERESCDSRIGRRPVLLSINPDCIYFAGIECSSWSINFAVINASQKLVHQDSRPLNHPSTEDIFTVMDEAIRSFRADHPEIWEKIPSLVISMPGEIDSENGIGLSYASVKDWHNVDMKSHFKALGKTLYFVHNVDSMLTGYCVKKHIDPNATVLFLIIRNGTGVRLYSQGTLLSKYGVMCEFGHMKAENSNRLCFCGRRGCYDAEITTVAILNKIQEAVSTNKLSAILAKCGNDPKAVTVDAFLELVEEGDPDAREIFIEVAQYIAKLLSQIYLLCTPDLVVLCSELCRILPLFKNVVENSEEIAQPYREKKGGNIDYVLPLGEFAELGGAIIGYSKYFDVSIEDD